MEVLDCEELDKEFDRILEESEPCETCNSVEDLAVVVITSEEDFGTILVICANCHIEADEEFEEGREITQHAVM